MPTVEKFVDRKAKQLAFYVKAYLDHQINYAEVDLFFWDTMEEWAQIEQGKQLPYSKNEKVFWHLMHQIHFWPQQSLLHDSYLRGELETCVDFLQGAGQYPFPIDCIGIRP